ncbi:unnamed protein product [Absidia cylindrospora]
MASDSSSDEDNTASKANKKKKPTKKTPTAKTKQQPKKTPKKKTTATPKKKKTKVTKARSDDDQGRSDENDSDASSASSGSNNKRTKTPISLAILQDTDDSDSDDESTSKPRKQLSRKAKLEMQREAQRSRRDTHVKIQPRVMRKTIDSFLKKLDTGENEDLSSRSPSQLEDDNVPQNGKAKQSPSRINIYTKYKKELQKLEEFNNNNPDDDEDDGLIIVRTESRSTKFMKTFLSAVSPEKTSRLQRTAGITNRMKGKPSSPLALRTLNQQLMAKMTQEQQAHRQEMEEKAKAMGVYLSAEERATKHLEREQEAAVLDLEVQQLLHKKAMQQQQRQQPTGSNDMDDEEDGDYVEGNDDGIVFSGEEDEDDDDNDNDGDDSNDDSDDEHIVLSRRRKLASKQKNPFLDDDEDEPGVTKKALKAPEPAHSIVNFFAGKPNNAKGDDHVDDALSTDQPKALTRLMQRTTIEEEEQQDHDNEIAPDQQSEASDNEDMDHTPAQQPTPFAKPAAPKKPKERNDYVEEEAEEEEDEFFGLGGPDIAESADLDEFEEDGMLVQDGNNNENVNSSELQAAYHKNMIESDQHMVERLIKDITGGGLRRKRAAAAAGLLLEDYDLFDDDDTNDLVALRLAAAKKRKKFMKGDDIMNHLASDPKTAAFAKAAMVIPGELDLSGDELEDNDNDDGNGEQEKDKKDDDKLESEYNDDDDDQLALGDGAAAAAAADSVVADMDDLNDDDDEEMNVNINMVVGDFIEPWSRQPGALNTPPTHS